MAYLREVVWEDDLVKPVPRAKRGMAEAGTIVAFDKLSVRDHYKQVPVRCTGTEAVVEDYKPHMGRTLAQEPSQLFHNLRSPRKIDRTLSKEWQLETHSPLQERSRQIAALKKLASPRQPNSPALL